MHVQRMNNDANSGFCSLRLHHVTLLTQEARAFRSNSAHNAAGMTTDCGWILLILAGRLSKEQEALKMHAGYYAGGAPDLLRHPVIAWAILPQLDTATESSMLAS